MLLTAIARPCRRRWPNEWGAVLHKFRSSRNERTGRTGRSEKTGLDSSRPRKLLEPQAVNSH